MPSSLFPEAPEGDPVWLAQEAAFRRALREAGPPFNLYRVGAGGPGAYGIVAMSPSLARAVAEGRAALEAPRYLDHPTRGQVAVPRGAIPMNASALLAAHVHRRGWAALALDREGRLVKEWLQAVQWGLAQDELRFLNTRVLLYKAPGGKEVGKVHVSHYGLAGALYLYCMREATYYPDLLMAESRHTTIPGLGDGEDVNALWEAAGDLTR